MADKSEDIDIETRNKLDRAFLAGFLLFGRICITLGVLYLIWYFFQIHWDIRGLISHTWISERSGLEDEYKIAAELLPDRTYNIQIGSPVTALFFKCNGTFNIEQQSSRLATSIEKTGRCTQYTSESLAHILETNFVPEKDSFYLALTYHTGESRTVTTTLVSEQPFVLSYKAQPATLSNIGLWYILLALLFIIAINKLYTVVMR